ncbi:hypothetical protein JXA12_03790 [Candidatus Woesearchaeota archaeon]|nr:hypothetical protein [Candidatus Woesearchaeota archaeon]
MHVWVCNGCHAEIPGEKRPDRCPLCGQGAKGFDEGEREDPPEEDKKYSELYRKALEQLEEYEEG